MNSNEPRIQDSEDLPEKRRGIEDSDPLDDPTFNSSLPPWLNQLPKSSGLFKLMAPYYTVNPGLRDPEELLLERQEVKVEEAEPSEKVDPYSLIPSQTSLLQWAYQFNRSPRIEQIVTYAESLELSYEIVWRYFEGRRKLQEIKEKPEKMETPQDQPLTNGSIIRTYNLASHVMHLISKDHIPLEIFANRVIGISQSALSEMINHPKLSENLEPERVKLWERMLAWVKLCEKDRKAVLDGEPTDCCPFEALKDPQHHLHHSESHSKDSGTIVV